MVLLIPILLMYSIQPTLSVQTYNCCSGPPIWALGPPPKPPWLKYKLECNSKGGKYENSSVDLKESTAAFQDSTSTALGPSETTFSSLESTDGSNVTTTFSLTAKTDLTTEIIQQSTPSTNPSTENDLTTILTQTMKNFLDINTENDQTSDSYSLDSTTVDHLENSESSFTTEDISISTIDTFKTDEDSVTYTTLRSVNGPSNNETNATNSRDSADMQTSTAIISTTVDFNSMVLNATQDFTDANDTQHDESSEGDEDDTVLGGLTVVQLVILILCVLLLIAVFVILIIYVKRKYKATVKPDIVKEEETNYLYNYRILGRAWRGRQRQTSWRPKRTIGPEDRKYLVSGTPSSQLSLASNETEQSPNGDDEKEIPGTRRSSTSSGIGTSQGDSGPEAGSLSGCKPEFSALPILSPIKSSAGPDKSQTSRIDSKRYVDPQALSGKSPGVVSVTNLSQNAVVSLPNPKNWNIDDEKIGAEQRHGKLAPSTETSVADRNDHPKTRRKKKRSTSSQETNQSPQSVPLKTISNGKINSKLKLLPTPEVSGESQA